MAGSCSRSRRDLARSAAGSRLSHSARSFTAWSWLRVTGLQGVLSGLAGLGGQGNRRQGVDPGRVVQPGRGRLAKVQRLRRVGHGLAVLTQGRESQAAAEVGVGVRGIEPDGLLKVAQRRARGVGYQVKRPATCQQWRTAADAGRSPASGPRSRRDSRGGSPSPARGTRRVWPRACPGPAGHCRTGSRHGRVSGFGAASRRSRSASR